MVLWEIAQAFLVARDLAPNQIEDGALLVCLVEIESQLRWTRKKIRRCCQSLAKHLPHLITVVEKVDDGEDAYLFTWRRYLRAPLDADEPPDVRAAFDLMEADLETATWGFNDEKLGRITH